MRNPFEEINSKLDDIHSILLRKEISTNKSYEFISLPDVLRKFSISRPTLTKLIEKKAFPYYKVGRKIYFKMSEVEKSIKAK